MPLFDGLLLHEATRHQLEQVIKNPSHAVLLEGPEGLGKTLLLRELAAALLAVETDKLDTHPYVRTLTVDKQSIPIEQVRDLQAFLSRMVPGRATIKRIVLVPDADLLTIPAQNAFLKLLEEPPRDTAILLSSSRAHRMLATVLSRTQRIQVATPSESAVIEHLSAAYPLASIKRAQLMSGSNLAATIQLLADADDEASLLPLVKQFLGSTAFDRLILVEPLTKDKIQALSFVDTLISLATASMHHAAANNPSGISRWQSILRHSLVAQGSLMANGSTKLTMTELALSF